jgi:cell shape-determining protein MreC
MKTLSDANLKRSIVMVFFNSLISSHQSRRMMANETLNRYIFTLNKVYESEVYSMQELIQTIQYELEGSFKEKIDKKTLKRILDLLSSQDLIKIHKYKITRELNVEDSE